MLKRTVCLSETSVSTYEVHMELQPLSEMVWNRKFVSSAKTSSRYKIKARLLRQKKKLRQMMLEETFKKAIPHGAASSL
jgi:hypothetical protein